MCVMHMHGHWRGCGVYDTTFKIFLLLIMRSGVYIQEGVHASVFVLSCHMDTG